MKAILTLVALLIVFAGCTKAVENKNDLFSDKESPNIVLIYVDDLGYKDLACYGNEFFESPQIDKLLSKGIRFTEAYANAPLCAPSRIGLLSGQHCARAGCYEVTPGSWNELRYFRDLEKRNPGSLNLDWQEKVKFNQPPNKLDLPRDRKIMPEYLKEVGYFTGFFGKWHVGPQRPNERGFDEFVQIETTGRPGAQLDVSKGRLSKSEMYPEPNGNIGDYMTEVSMHFIDRAKDKPFFLYMSHPLIHTPLEADSDLLNKYKAKTPTLLHKNAVYAGMVEMLDNSIAKLIAGLEERNLMDNTLIIFTSDNGGMTGVVKENAELDGYELGEYTSHYPLRGGKVQLFEGGIRIPMGVIYGDKLKACEVDGMISQLDILPTLLEITGHPESESLKSEFDGKSFVPVLTNPEYKMEERSMFWHFPAYRGLSLKPAKGSKPGFVQRPTTVIRRGNWKLHESLETGEVQLYNLKDDIGESENVADNNKELVKSLKAELKAWRKNVNAPMPIPKQQ